MGEGLAGAVGAGDDMFLLRRIGPVAPSFAPSIQATGLITLTMGLIMLTTGITGTIIRGGGLLPHIARGGTTIAGLSGRGNSTASMAAWRLRSSHSKRMSLRERSLTSPWRRCPTWRWSRKLGRAVPWRLPGILLRNPVPLLPDISENHRFFSAGT